MRIVDIIHNRPFCDEQWIKAASKGGTQGELRPPPLDDVYKNPDYTHQFETKSKIIMPLSLESGHLSKSKKEDWFVFMKCSMGKILESMTQ